MLSLAMFYKPSRMNTAHTGYGVHAGAGQVRQSDWFNWVTCLGGSKSSADCYAEPEGGVLDGQ